MGRKEGMQTVLEMKQKWKKFSATRKTKVQNGMYFFERVEERREMVKSSRRKFWNTERQYGKPGSSTREDHGLRRQGS